MRIGWRHAFKFLSSKTLRPNQSLQPRLLAFWFFGVIRHSVSRLVYHRLLPLVRKPAELSR